MTQNCPFAKITDILQKNWGQWLYLKITISTKSLMSIPYAQDEPVCQGLTVKGPHVHSQSPEGRLEEVSAEPARRYKEQEQWQERERRQGVARNQKRGERIHALGRVLWSSWASVEEGVGGGDQLQPAVLPPLLPLPPIHSLYCLGVTSSFTLIFPILSPATQT